MLVTFDRSQLSMGPYLEVSRILSNRQSWTAASSSLLFWKGVPAEQLGINISNGRSSGHGDIFRIQIMGEKMMVTIIQGRHGPVTLLSLKQADGSLGVHLLYLILCGFLLKSSLSFGLQMASG